ncbi:MAG: cyclodeaminase/cyclohydrolase family protein, partial [Calditrichaceae bacterium]
EFKIEERVLGLPEHLNGHLVQLKVKDFIGEVSRESPTPGGGSVAALAGALGAALESMVSNLTANKRGSEKIDKILNETAENSQEIVNDLMNGIDADTDAFNAFIKAKRLPSRTSEEKKIKFEAEQKGLKEAVLVPFNTAELSFNVIKLAETVVQYGNPASITDAAVGALIAYAGVKSGIYNVLVNLKDVRDEKFVKDLKEKCSKLKDESEEKLSIINKLVESKIK